jgi:myo-inositol 2-dehydrogenase/D-chiro-inositol 1-dehydrogenase/scyllo-inositol 2-dehydrogenase (NAD+)
VDGTCPCHYGYDARIEVLCENGLIQAGSLGESRVTTVRREGEIVSEACRSWRSLFREAYLAEMEHFVSCIRDGSTPSVTGEDGLKAVEAVVAANRSIREGRAVSLEGRH